MKINVLQNFAVCLCCLLLFGCASTLPARGEADASTETGLASYYHSKSHGRRTTSGERLDQNTLTGAHRTLPFGTVVRVHNLQNGKHVDVRINDRGPHVKGRIIDVTLRAAKILGMTGKGVARVRLEVLPGKDEKDGDEETGPSPRGD